MKRNFVAGANQHTKNIGWQIANSIDGSILRKGNEYFPEYVGKTGNVSLTCSIGGLDIAAFQDKTSTEIEKEIAQNLTVPLKLISSFISAYPTLNKRIILISSMAHRKALNGHSVYGAAKAGIVSFVRHLAYEEAKLRDCFLKIWCIAPGTVAYTPMLEKTVRTTGIMKRMSQEEIVDGIAKSFPSGKMVSVESIIGVVKFCLSGQADQMSGHCFEIENNQR